MNTVFSIICPARVFSGLNKLDFFRAFPYSKYCERLERQVEMFRYLRLVESAYHNAVKPHLCCLQRHALK